VVEKKPKKPKQRTEKKKPEGPEEAWTFQEQKKV